LGWLVVRRFGGCIPDASGLTLSPTGLPAIALGMDPADGDNDAEKPALRTRCVFSWPHPQDYSARHAHFRFCGSVLLRLRTDVETTHRRIFTLVLTQLIHVFECKSRKPKKPFEIKLFNNILAHY